MGDLCNTYGSLMAFDVSECHLSDGDIGDGWGKKMKQTMI